MTAKVRITKFQLGSYREVFCVMVQGDSRTRIIEEVFQKYFGVDTAKIVTVY